MSDNIVSQAIDAVNKGSIAFSKFITANDTGVNGAHQSGFYLHKSSFPLFFDKPGVKGENKDKKVKIKWQNNSETDSRFIYYGSGTRNEYRLTRVSQDFLREENIGDLLILIKQTDDYYEAFVLSTEEEIESFLAGFGLTPQETNQILPKTNRVNADDQVLNMFDKYISGLKTSFPTTIEIADIAREIIINAVGISLNEIKVNPDRELLRWLGTEYELFKAIENSRYAEYISKPFKDVEALINTANSILNRRKSRAGKSLEHHLAKMFDIFDLRYSEQPTTEGNNKPDFIFPGEEEYHNLMFEGSKLVFLASKTTCKDRWRQILTEAERIQVKHLFTLQQGISTSQLKEMYSQNIQLIVPEKYIIAYPEQYRGKINTLEQFVTYVRGTQK